MSTNGQDSISKKYPNNLSLEEIIETIALQEEAIKGSLALVTGFRIKFNSQ